MKEEVQGKEEGGPWVKQKTYWKGRFSITKSPVFSGAIGGRKACFLWEIKNLISAETRGGKKGRRGRKKTGTRAAATKGGK